MRTCLFPWTLPGLILIAATLCACERAPDSQSPATETATPRPWIETLEVDGDIKAAASTALAVPGSGFESRQLMEMVPEGSEVRKGQVVARFDAPQARMELSRAEIELLRQMLGEAALSSEVKTNRADVVAQNAIVQADLNLSERYANTDLTIFPRSKILDALQDVGFLKSKQTYLNWKNGQIDRRNAAQRAVLASKEDSVKLTATQKRASLAALDLAAPHDGVFLLVPGWDGSKPEVGANLWSGQAFGTLPDANQLVARFSVAEGLSFGLKIGLPVHVRMAGTGTEIDLKVTKVSSNASTASSDSPVKYSEFEAAIDHDTAMHFDLKPGQALHGTVSLIDRATVLTVPNIALVQEGPAEATTFAVFVREGDHNVKRTIELGMRGPVRSEVKSGLNAAAHVILVPESGRKKS
jgi:multidrug efflux pump subunit AcrA (membrane-fusion protein)